MCIRDSSLHDAALWTSYRHRLLTLHARMTSTVVAARRARHSATSSLPESAWQPHCGLRTPAGVVTTHLVGRRPFDIAAGASRAG
eukprot:2411356-Prymnesium_polylepis.1